MTLLAKVKNKHSLTIYETLRPMHSPSRPGSVGRGRLKDGKGGLVRVKAEQQSWEGRCGVGCRKLE